MSAARYILSIGLLSLSISLFAQPKTDTIKVLGDTLDNSDNTEIEKLIENQTQDVEESSLLDKLKRLEANPLELNTASIFELQTIPFIDAIIAKRIVSRRVKLTKFVSVSQLKDVEGIDAELYNKIRRYVYVKNAKSDYVKDEFGKVNLYRPSESVFRNFNFFMRSRFTNDLQPSVGYYKADPNDPSKKVYNGTRPKIYNRFDLSYSKDNMKISSGLVTEKDAGEKKLFDFIGGYVEYKNKGILKQLLVGDYTLEFGQGITLWSSLSFSKGNEATATIKKDAGEIDSYTSVNEVQFFRGAATKLNFDSPIGNINLFGFYSNNTFDATFDSTTGVFSTLYVDGYHRTTSELNRYNSGREKMFGGRFEFTPSFSNSARLGVTYYNSTYSDSFKTKDLYDFSGSKFDAVGVDYDFTVSNFNIFGEFARNKYKAIGGMSGIKFVFLNIADFLVAVRNYPKDFVMLHSFGFSETSGNVQNEFGIYTGVKFKIKNFATINAYFDQYKFPYRTFYNPIPTTGTDFLVYGEWKLSKGLNLITRYKNENKEDVTTIINQYGIEEKKIYERNQINYRLQLDYDLSRRFRIRTRTEYVFVDYQSFLTSQKGLLFFSDFRVGLTDNLLLDGRYIIFQTDSYDSRLYEYENELTGVVSNQALYGKGRRWYLMLKYKPYKFLQLSARYSETFFDGVKSIGSGNDEVLGDFKNRFALQLEVKF